jgi:PIN domain nuclease of toxin-antitoxin system
LQINVSVKNLTKDCAENDLSVINISPDVLSEYEKLQLIHNYPFDRLLIAQAKYLDFTLITKDSMIKKYDVKTFW